MLDPACGDQPFGHRLVVHAQPCPAHRGRYCASVKDSDGVLPVESGETDELIQNPSLLACCALLIPLGYTRYELLPRRVTDC